MIDRRIVVSTAAGGAGNLLGGAACLGRGLALLVRAPGLWLLGLVPALLALVILCVVLAAAFAFGLPLAVALLTPFAAGWPAPERDALRLLVGAVLAASALWLAVVSFTTLAQTIGEPFYDAIARRVEVMEGGLRPEADGPPWWLATARAARDGLLMIGLSVGLGLGLLLLGLVPLLGETLVPVLGVCTAGWLLTLALTQVPLERRGLALPGRLRLLWRHRTLALGFGLSALLLFLLPLGAVIGMPGAVAGATLLARKVAPATE